MAPEDAAPRVQVNGGDRRRPMERTVTMTTRNRVTAVRAFTLIELLVVIAIIAILAAILFPVFGVVREQAHQSNTMSSLHSTYVAVKMYDDDENHFPNNIFPFVETPVVGATLPPYNRPVVGCVPSGGGSGMLVP